MSVFYSQQLRLDKNLFRILAILSDNGEYIGNKRSLRERLNLSDSSKNNKALDDAINELEEMGFLTCKRLGNTYLLEVIPKGRKIEAEKKRVDALIGKRGFSRSVAWEQVLKVYLWLLDHAEIEEWNRTREKEFKIYFRRESIGWPLNISVDTVSNALHVLQNDFNAIRKETIVQCITEGEFETKGLFIERTAWWTTD